MEQQEFVRVIEVGTIGATEETVKLYRCDIDEMIEVCSCCIQNEHGTQTIKGKIGVLSGGIEYCHRAAPAIAAVGGCLSLYTCFYAREGEDVICRITGSGADTNYRISMQGFLSKTR